MCIPVCIYIYIYIYIYIIIPGLSSGQNITRQMSQK